MGNLHLPCFNQGLYPSILDTKLPLNTEIKGLRRGRKNVDKLRRYKVTPASWWPLSPSNPGYSSLYIYYLALKSTGQINTYRDLVKILSSIQSKWRLCEKKGLNSECEGDFFRTALKKLSSYCYVKTFEVGPQYMPFVHLHQLLGAAPYELSSILKDVSLWVDDKIDGKPKQLNDHFFDKTLDEVFLSWGPKKTKSLGFKDWCNDFLRWGTSGGAPRTDIEGKRHRTKWAFAYGNSTSNGRLKESYDLYALAKSMGEKGTIALKEEPAKTREVIATSMPSYLRQGYLLWRNGNPDIPSPATNPYYLTEFELENCSWYGCIDGERFDHTIPISAVEKLLIRLGEVDDECRAIAREEIESIKNLTLEWDSYSWKYKGGLLSGWRITSILGTLVSIAAAKFIQSLYPHVLLKYGAMGDDLVLYTSGRNLTRRELVYGYNQFGLRSNENKTVSGPVGEFLRKVRCKGGSFGFPALGLKSIVYASPWVSTYTYERELEVANSWLTLLSRLLPHCVPGCDVTDFYFRHCSAQLRSQIQPLNWLPWLKTPISAGGGGCQELASPYDQWVTVKFTYTSFAQRVSSWLPTRLGIFKRTLIQTSLPTIIPLLPQEIRKISEDMKRTSVTRSPVRVRDDVSLTKLIFSIMEQPTINRKHINTFLQSPLPKNLRTSSRTTMCEAILTPPSKESVMTSIVHTKESQSGMNMIGNYFLKYYRLLKPTKARELPAAITLYFQHMHHRVMLPIGTW